ncbi:guanine deaminase [Elusimicrobium posterum]|uniref:nucleoside deaminase n=1 Tax=Elusimicrobium posterum TaxID=3116653 RepID=UPI003C7591E6
MDNKELEQHKKFLDIAINLAKENMLAGKGGPFGAVIVKDGEIVAQGFNQVTTANDPTCHAEVDAIRKACQKVNNFELNDCIIYSSCEPCPMCLGAIYWARPKALIFAADKHTAAKHGFDDKFIYDEIALPYEKRSIKTMVVKTDNFEEPFNLWDKKENKVEY